MNALDHAIAANIWSTMIVVMITLLAVANVVRHFATSYRKHTQDVAAKNVAKQRSDINSQLLNQVIQVMIEQNSYVLPKALNTVSKATYATVKSNKPVKISIRSGEMSCRLIHPLLNYSNIRGVTVDGHQLRWSLHNALRCKQIRDILKSNKLLQALTISDIGTFSHGSVINLIQSLKQDIHTLGIHKQKVSDWYNPQHQLKCPSSVKHLSLKNIMWSVLLCEGLTSLQVEGAINSNIQLPNSLRSFNAVNCKYEQHLPTLPHGLETLDLSASGMYYSLADMVIPNTVTNLKLPHHFTNSIGRLPSKLEHLDTGYSYYDALGALPNTLQTLVMKRTPCMYGSHYLHSLGTLPQSLKVLKVSTMFCSIGTLPDSIEVLHCENQTHALGRLPQSLRVLHIDGMEFNHELGKLPTTLEELNLGRAFEFDKSLGRLPQSLRKLTLHTSYRLPLIDKPAHCIVLYRDSERHTRLTAERWPVCLNANEGCTCLTTCYIPA
jgi:hypothetical protein